MLVRALCDALPRRYRCGDVLCGDLDGRVPGQPLEVENAKARHLCTRHNDASLVDFLLVLLRPHTILLRAVRKRSRKVKGRWHRRVEGFKPERRGKVDGIVEAHTAVRAPHHARRRPRHQLLLHLRNRWVQRRLRELLCIERRYGQGR